MSTPLVTGAAGFVGANLVRSLLARGHRVHALVRPGSDRWRLPVRHPDLVVHELDISDADGLHRLVHATSPSTVFHLAAHGAYPSQRDALRMVDVNVRATAALLDAIVDSGVQAMVVAGSSSEYGFKDHAPSEDEVAVPNSDYAVTKLAATDLCRHRAVATGAPVVVLRLGSVYGPWEEPTRLVPTLVRAALAGGLPPLAEGRTARDFVFVDDVVAAFELAAGAAVPCAGRVYNIGSGEQQTLLDVVELARSVFAVEVEPVWGSYPSRSWDTTCWVTDPRRAAAELGWRATVGLREGLLATAEWLRDGEVERALRSR